MPTESHEPSPNNIIINFISIFFALLFITGVYFPFFFVTDPVSLPSPPPFSTPSSLALILHSPTPAKFLFTLSSHRSLGILEVSCLHHFCLGRETIKSNSLPPRQYSSPARHTTICGSIACIYINSKDLKRTVHFQVHLRRGFVYLKE